MADRQRSDPTIVSVPTPRSIPACGPVPVAWWASTVTVAVVRTGHWGVSLSEVEIRLSGVVEFRRDGRVVDLPGRRVRALLVLLAVSAGRVVSTDTLVRGIWDDDPPENARGSLQTSVGRLRRALGDDAVATRTSGYVLSLPRSCVDLLRFEDLVDEASAADGESARAVLRSALALWRGEPFGDAPSTWIERQLVSPWVERYLHAYERRVDLDLDAGRHAATVPELRDLIERHPLRETLWARLLTALHGAGRTADALERYEALRTRLADELGVDPSPELQQLYRRMLSAEPPAMPAPEPPPPPGPHQLPGRIGGFTGRAEQLEALDKAVESGTQLLALHGPGGVGKTTLAVQWGHRARALFPDGELFVDLRGYGPGEPLSAVDVLGSLLRGLGVHGTRIPGDEEDRHALLRSELVDRRMLLVLDNAREAGQVRPLLPGGDSVVLVTSRSQLRGLAAREGAYRVPVDPMRPEDAVALLRHRLGEDPAPSYDENLTELAALCGHLPVALTVAAERASRHGARRLELVNERLRSERDRLGTLTDWEDDPLVGVRAVFAWSFDVLDADTARMFRLLGLFPDSQIAVETAAALAGTDARDAERALDRLTDLHLLAELRAGWYELHDLTRAYAGEVVEDDSDAERAAAVRRLRSWYVHSTRNASFALTGPPLVDGVVGAPAPDTSPVELSTEADASRWISEHLRTIRSVLSEATKDGDHDTVATLTPSLGAHYRATGALHEWLTLCETAQPSARAVDDPVTEGMLCNQLGNAHDVVGDLDRALDAFRRARSIFEAAGNEHGTLLVDLNLGAHFGYRGQPDVELTHYESALRSANRTGRLDQLASLKNNLASCYLDLGRLEDALEAAEAAVGIHRESVRPPVERATHLLTLAEVQSAAARWTDAHETLTETVELSRRLGFRTYEVVALQLLGSAQRALDLPGEARRSWLVALRLLETVNVSEFTGLTPDRLRAMIEQLPPEPA